MRTFLKNPLAIVLVAAFLLRLTLVDFGTLNLDFNTFIAWSVNLAQNGFRSFYNNWSDYFPGYLYVLRTLGKIRGILPDVLLYKLPAILADLATGYLIYKIVEDIKGKRWGIVAANVYLFNPAIWANSALWGQVDGLTAFFALLSVFLFEKNIFLSAGALAVGTLIKPQAAFAFPVILFLFLKNKRRFTELVTYCVVGLLVFVLAFVPFSSGGNLITFIIERFQKSLGQYPYTSVNAFNFWGIFGFWRNDSFVTQVIGILGVVAVLITSGVKLLKKEKGKYLLLSMMFLSTFLFLTRIHERHLLPAFAPLTIAAAFEPILFLPLLGFSVIYLLNLYYSFNWISDGFKTVFPPEITTVFSVFSIVIFAALMAFVINHKYLKSVYEKVKEFFAKKQKKMVGFPKLKLSIKSARLILVTILLFSLGTRLYRLSSPKEMYFDEVYHAFTAKLVLHNDPKAWEWWNQHPEGFAYEWTHPPLAKLFMAGGMKIFGENSFGWRFPAAILGMGIVYLVYVLAKELFQDEALGLLSAAAFSLEGLALVMSRIGMNDTYFLFFALLAIYLFLKERDFTSAISFGFALASKWSAIWAIPIFFVLWLHQKKKFRLSIFWFLLLPFTIYLLTYLQMFLTGHDLNIFWGMQKQMWWYHTRLTATHAYGSPSFSWPLMLRPVYLYTSNEVSGWVSRIYAIGNPLVFWFGLVSIITTAVFAFVEHNKKLGLIVFCYLIFFIPWAASPRIMFLYHYLPSLPFLAIATGYVLRRFPKTIAYFLVPSALLFIYFYPHWAGLKIPLWLDSSYYWFSSWR